MSLLDYAAAELPDDDDRMPLTVEQQIAGWLLPLEKMAVAISIGRVVGHEFGPAEWDVIGRAADLCLTAYCRRCTYGQVSIHEEGGAYGEWCMDLTECLMPCAESAELREAMALGQTWLDAEAT